MLTEISQVVVLAFGAIVCAMSLWGLAAPEKMMTFVYGAMEKDWGIHLAVGLRVLLGAALLVAAPGSRFPLLFEILGWIAIVAAVAILLMGRERLHKIVAYFKGLPGAMIRGWLVFGAAFGVLLVYGMV